MVNPPAVSADRRQSLPAACRLVTLLLVSVLALGVTVPAWAMQIFIRQQNGVKHTIEVEAGQLIGEVKTLTFDKTGIPEIDQRLFYGGVELADALSIADYNIPKESTLHLLTAQYFQLADGSTKATAFQPFVETSLENESAFGTLLFDYAIFQNETVSKSLGLDLNALTLSGSDFKVGIAADKTFALKNGTFNTTLSFGTNASLIIAGDAFTVGDAFQVDAEGSPGKIVIGDGTPAAFSLTSSLAAKFNNMVDLIRINNQAVLTVTP